MGLIDSHCHLQYDYAPKTGDDLVREALEEGLEALVNVATEIGTLGAVAAYSERHAQVFHTAGVHPHEAKELPELSALAAVREAGRHPKCVAIGEIGLDYYYDHSPPAAQIPVFERQLEIARELGKPIVIHARDAEKDLLACLQTHVAAWKASGHTRSPGVIHCFTGTFAFGQACIDLGFYISFSGILTFKNAEDLRTSAAAYPIERLLVETDSPYLAPIPNRGKKCEPKMVRYTALELARVKGLTLDAVIDATSRNTRAVFGLCEC